MRTIRLYNNSIRFRSSPDSDDSCKEEEQEEGTGDHQRLVTDKRDKKHYGTTLHKITPVPKTIEEKVGEQMDSVKKRLQVCVEKHVGSIIAYEKVNRRFLRRFLRIYVPVFSRGSIADLLRKSPAKRFRVSSSFCTR